MSMDSRVFRALAISGWTRSVRLRSFVIGGGHLARFGLDFVAERGDGFHHAGAGAIGAGLAEHALESLLGALAGDADEAEFVEATGPSTGRLSCSRACFAARTSLFRGCGALPCR